MPNDHPPQAAPAGWYPDSIAPGQLRWFDGAVWTEHVAPQQQPHGHSGVVEKRTWTLFGISAELTATELRLSASSMARVLLGGSLRTIPISSIEAVEYRAPTALKNGELVVADKAAKSSLMFAKKQTSEAQSLYSALATSRPEAAGVRSAAPGWTQAGEGLQAEAGMSASSKVAARTAARVQAAETLLEQAVEAATRGDVTHEQALISEAMGAKNGFFDLGGDQVTRRVDELIAAGHLRRGAELLGTVGPPAYVKKVEAGTHYLVSNEAIPIQIFSDRVIQGNVTHPIDESTFAQVFLDGQQQITQGRPGMLGLLLMSPLPGSALGPAMAVAKDKVTDTRTAEFQIGSKDWHLRVAIAPGLINEPRAIAERINKLSASLEAPKSEDSTTDALVSASTGKLEHLERLVALHEKGILSADEFAKLKNEVINE